MKVSGRREGLTLFLGDIFFLVLSLWVTLLIRNSHVPSKQLFYSHLVPFLLLFAVSVIIFFIAGLYEKHTVILKTRLPFKIFRTQIINSVIAVIFFYFVPYFGIAPKTTLFLYLFISFFLVVLWRLYIYTFFAPKKTEKALLIGAGKEIEELVNEINKNPNYGLRFEEIINLDQKDRDIETEIKSICGEKNISIIVIDLEHDKIKPILSSLYNLIFSNVRFLAMYKIYEDVFKRVPFSVLQYNWFLENVSTSPKIIHDVLKRVVDIALSFIGSIIALLFVPFVFILMAFEDRGALFIVQERIGQGGKMINIIKFRSMKTNDRGIWVKEKDERITKVGEFLRKTRIDEFPQFWNVLMGDFSLIGPRPDVKDLGEKLKEEIPYYQVRNVITPGMSGWAQINQELPPQSLEETKVRLAYDLYYVKNRSFVLDLQIILKTIRILLSRSGK